MLGYQAVGTPRTPIKTHDGGSNHEDNFNEDSSGYSSGGGCGGYDSYESDGDNGDYDGQY